MANKPNEQELRQQKTAEAVSKTELFFQKNAKLIYGCVAAVLLVALCILAYNRFIYQPKKAEAQKEMFKAEQNRAEVRRRRFRTRAERRRQQHGIRGNHQHLRQEGR